MDGWLKFLIAAACVVVVAGGGYMGVKEWRQASRVAEIQSQAASQAKAREQMQSDPDYIACRNALNSSALGEAKRLRDSCRQRGFITYDEQLKAEGVRP